MKSYLYLAFSICSSRHCLNKNWYWKIESPIIHCSMKEFYTHCSFTSYLEDIVGILMLLKWLCIYSEKSIWRSVNMHPHTVNIYPVRYITRIICEFIPRNMKIYQILYAYVWRMVCIHIRVYLHGEVTFIESVYCLINICLPCSLHHIFHDTILSAHNARK